MHLTPTGIHAVFHKVSVCSRRFGVGVGWQILLANMHRKFGAGERASYSFPMYRQRRPITLRGGSSDFLIFDQIMIEDEYAPLRNMEISTVLDLGANIGLASIWFLNHFENARVVAVEANPDNYNAISNNLGPYGERINLVRGAVWPRRADLSIARRVNESDAQVHESLPTDDPKDRISGWDIPSLMELGKFKTLDLLKIDIEGSEIALFRSGAERWLPLTKNICIELHGPQCETAFFESLHDYSFDQVTSGELTICMNLRRKGSAA